MTWGEELFTPVSYNSFRIGPFTMTTKVQPGETHEQAFERAWKALAAMARAQYQQKRDGYLQRLRDVGAAARGNG